MDDIQIVDGIQITYYQVHCPLCDYPTNVYPDDIHCGIAKCVKCHKEFGIVILNM